MIKINGEIVPQDNFPAGELLIKYKILNNKHMSIKWYYENDAELFALICIKRHIDEKCPKCFCELIMPYICHARMDRIKNNEDIFTLKYFCETINSLNFDSVTVLDAHSNVSLALLNNVKSMNVKSFIDVAISNSAPDVIFFPDEGAMKRYSEVVSVKKPIAFGMKKRDWSTGAILGLDVFGNVEALNGAKVLIIDDICSRGGTFYHSAKKLKELGAAEIDLYITHCEDTIQEGELLKDNGLINKIYTTNSLIKIKNEKIEVIPL